MDEEQMERARDGERPEVKIKSVIKTGGVYKTTLYK
jgi:hypothetical protein